jgi:hypothetical protein
MMSKFDRQITDRNELIEYFISRFGMTKDQAINELNQRFGEVDNSSSLDKTKEERNFFYNR